MKKQIFKLTSILLAMVMVFSLFTIIPISAEGESANLHTAVEGLKTAWGNLDYEGYKHSQWINYIGGWLNDSTRASYASATSPDYAPSIHNYTFTVNSTTKQILWGSQRESAGMETFKLFDELKANIEDMYFYYRSTGDVNIRVASVLNNGVDADPLNGNEYLGKDFTSVQTLESTDGEWRKFSWNEFLTKELSGHTVQSAFHSADFANWDYFLRIGFYMSADSDVEFSVGDLFAEVKDYDVNLLNTENFTDGEWYEKAVAVDENALKADYRDAADSETWLAFLSALEAVRACEKEAVESLLRAAAGEMITSATYYDKPVKSATRTDAAAYITPVVSNNSKYGSHTATVDLPAQSANNQVTGSLWFNNTIGSDRGEKYYGDYPEDTYFTVKVNSADAGAKLRFWFRPSGNNKLDAAFNYELPVVAGKEYKITLEKLFESGVSSLNSEWNEPIKDWRNNCTSASTSSYKYYVNIFCMFAYQGAVNVTVGSMVSTTNYTIPENIAALTGEEFVAAMTEVSLDDMENTAPFVALLNKAVGYYPELEKGCAVKTLKNAWQNLTFDGYVDRISANYVGNKTLGVNYYNAEGPDEAPESVDNRKIPITATETNIYYNEFNSNGVFESTATTTIPVKNIKDMYFYYKSTADITARFGAIGNNGAGSRQNSIFESAYTLPSTNGEWVRYSFDQWLVDNGSSWNWVITQHDMKNSTQLAGIGFAFAKTASSTDLYLSELFVQTGVDTNLEGCDEWSDIELIWNASELSLSDYSDSADSKEVKAFNDALAHAKEVFAEEFAVEELRAAASKMLTSITPVAYPGIDYSTGSLANISDYVSYTVDNAEYLTFGPAKTHAISVGASAGRNSGVWLTGGMNGRATWTGDASTEDTYVSIYVKSIANPSATPAVKIYTRTMPKGSAMKEEPGIYYLNGIEAGKTYKILLKDLLAVNNYTVADLAGSSLDMHFFSIQANGSDMELEVGSLITTNYYSPSDKVGADFIGEMATLDYSTYINTAEFEEKLAAALEVYPEVAANIAATKEVIDASKALDKIALKPNAYTFGDSLTVNNTVYGKSNKGDAFISFNNSVIGHETANATFGVVEYKTDKPLILADIDDLYFSYKAEGFKAAEGVEKAQVGARFYIYNEDFAFDTIYDEETGEVITKGATAWDCRFHSINGGLTYFEINGNTGDEWVTTSIATIMGADWKTKLLAVLNEADNVNGNPNWTDKTMEEVEISAIRLGFSNKYGTADVSLGSMYVDYVGDSDTAITASAADPEAVLEEARAIDLSSVNPVQANEFKKLVKALETKCIEFECNVTVKAGYIAGNWYESGITLKDLSVLSRYNDDKLDGTFCDVDAIGALTEETLRKQLLGIQ